MPAHGRHARLDTPRRQRARAVIAFTTLAVGLAIIASGAAGLALSRSGGTPAGPAAARVPAPEGPAAEVPWPSAHRRVARPVELTIPAIGVRTGLIRLGLTPAGTLQVPASPPSPAGMTAAPGPVRPAQRSSPATSTAWPALLSSSGWPACAQATAPTSAAPTEPSRYSASPPSAAIPRTASPPPRSTAPPPAPSSASSPAAAPSTVRSAPISATSSSTPPRSAEHGRVPVRRVHGHPADGVPRAALPADR